MREERETAAATMGTTPIRYSLEDAISAVVQNNDYGADEQRILAQVIRRAVHEIPEGMAHKCSFRLLKSGKYISVNMMNYLLFRAPAYTDSGGNPTFHFYLIYPSSMRGQELVPGVGVDARANFQFAHFGCINVGLYFSEFSSLNQQHWDLFEKACRMAAAARKSREWDSNFDV